MESGVRPIMSLAAEPTANTWLSSETATTDGSLRITPCPGMNTRILVVPKSIPILGVNFDNIATIIQNCPQVCYIANMLYLPGMQNNIGKSIADLRESAGLTQSELAKRLKTTQSAVARIETGKQNVSTDTLKKISKALGRNVLTLSPGSLNVEIEGGHKLSGVIETNTSKNGAVGLLFCL
jgi:DNA-binding XRE family transcriptional regulator